MNYWHRIKECECGDNLGLISPGTWWCAYCGRLMRQSKNHISMDAPRCVATMEARLKWYEKIMEMYEQAAQIITEATESEDRL